MPGRAHGFVSLVVIATLGVAQSSQAEDVPDFARDIRPLLSNKCFKCHGPADQQGGVRLDTFEGATAEGAIVPGDVHLSHLLSRVKEPDESRMPPRESSDRLTPEQVNLLERWIAAGATYAPHWAYQPIQVGSPPETGQDDWCQNPIDAYILNRLQLAGLRPSPKADRPTLIRRLSLDLRGILPDPQEVAAFVGNQSPEAYERLVDRWLASPHYGERQARLWLDLARYADSNGYTIDGPRSIWPWRDWVINAFNADQPFDQFTIEQLAGDLLPNPTREQLVATGFHRNTSFNEEGGTDKEQFRVERTIDRTNTTGSVWLGLTVGCAQCHDHKYDPISHVEYYQLYAFHNNIDEPTLSLTSMDQEQELAKVRKAIAATKKRRAALPPAKPLEEQLVELKAAASTGYHPLPPRESRTESSTTLRRLEDFSVLAEGAPSDRETYVVEGWSRLRKVTAVRLEALTDESLPKKGPGRAGNGNFVLNEFRFEVNGVPVPFSQALADHSQPDYAVSNLLRPKAGKGWAINGAAGSSNVNRTAVFVLKEPVETNDSINLRFTLCFDGSPAQYSLGRFRISLTDAEGSFITLPVIAQNLILKPMEELQESDRTQLTTLLNDSAESVAMQAEIQKLERKLKSLQAVVPTTLILKETQPSRTTNRFDRGDFLSPKEVVQPDVLKVLPPLAAEEGPRNRLDLARWLTRPDHPLTPRVTVNRFWQQFFGKGLVETENDFGFQGDFPTHPELLDWLAAEFVRSGWQVKKLHKTIVMSATYQQSSHFREELIQKDPYNKLLARQNRLRLDAEIIRDAALSASGLLTKTLGGPGVYPYQPPEVFSFTQSKRAWKESEGEDRYRRGMYTYLWRQSQHPLLTTFDAPDGQTACTRRNRSNTPLQALHLANDPVFVEIANGLAKRLIQETSPHEASRIDAAYEICFSRLPTDSERHRLQQFLASQQAENEEAKWTLFSRVLLNLDEFINRE